MGLFNSKTKKAKEVAQYLHKKYKYNRDLLSARDLESIKLLNDEIKAYLQAPPKEAAEAARKADALERKALKIFPMPRFSGIIENVDVFLMAIVLALAIRAYFVQPFKIPTDSMKPTLYGIQTVPLAEDVHPPFFQRVIDFAVQGKSYCRIETKDGGVVRSIRETRFLGIPLLPRTVVQIGSESFTLSSTVEEFAKGTDFKVRVGTQVPAGSVPVNYAVTSGDHIFVNKMIYHFRQPERGDVFVFTTKGIAGIAALQARQGSTSVQFYIKRAVGLGGDLLQIDPPYLLVNGEKLDGREIFERIYSKENGYHGYVIDGQSQFLNALNATHFLERDTFWAMGDNSPGSFDSRGWGAVPRENLVGTGMVVYWPFSSRWGLIR
jgi:signal peptidase I